MSSQDLLLVIKGENSLNLGIVEHSYRMKVHIRYWVSVGLLLLSFSVYASPSQVIEICDSCTIKTIKAGLEQADRHDTLLLTSPAYKEHSLLIDLPITLLGKGNPVIDGEDKGEVIKVIADSVRIEGITIVNVGTSYTTDYAAIRIAEASHFSIRNVQLESLFFGIYLEKARNGEVIGNTILGDAVDEFKSGNGIQLWYCKDVEVRDNRVEGVRDGIYLEFSDRISIKDNFSSNNVRYGLHFMFSNDDSYEGNIFEKNGAGVAVMFSKNIRMKHNIFRNNWGSASFGLLLKEINDAVISDNIFQENTIGISIEGSNRIEYQRNDFISNGWALQVRGACYTNTFTDNNFLHNSFDISYNSNINDNLFEKNYWSRYSGYDLDRNGIGDIPYRPVKLFSYIVNRTPETIILLRSLFMDIIDFSEKVSPVFTPDKLVDAKPRMKRIQ